MNNFANTLRVELLKARRSKMPWLTALGFMLLPLAGGFFMFIMRDPEMARNAGFISAKAELTMGTADWETYLAFLAQGIAVGGVILFGLVGSWIFGREFADRTAKDLLALPTARSSIVMSKFVVMAVWVGALTLLVCVLALGIGALLGLPQTSAWSISQGIVTLVLAGALTLLLFPPIAFFAGVGRGYLAPMGVTFVVVFFAQVIAIVGYGEFFPWAVPALFAQGQTLGAISYALVALTGAVGLAATLWWWEFADQSK